MTAVEGDLQAAGGSAAYQAQAEAAVAALRTSTRIPLLMTSATAGRGTNDALRSVATASGAILIDAEAQALQVGSVAVPPSWRSSAGLSGLGHERTAFRVLKDLAVWGSGNVANSHPVAPTRGTLAVGPAMQATPGESVEIPLSLAVEGTAHDVAFQAQTAGDVAPVVVQAGASSTGATGSVLLEGVHTGTVTGTAELTVPTTARAGEVIRPHRHRHGHRRGGQRGEGELHPRGEALAVAVSDTLAVADTDADADADADTDTVTVADSVSVAGTVSDAHSHAEPHSLGKCDAQRSGSFADPEPPRRSRAVPRGQAPPRRPARRRARAGSQALPTRCPVCTTSTGACGTRRARPTPRPRGAAPRSGRVSSCASRGGSSSGRGGPSTTSPTCHT
ncbi:hypothetical protein BW733_15315 [Tessaracoccus flavescens]|uniref:Uncharacterized protein n=1 Tax=Tessaracoccus flavescens TaxID=399497 RepID=A0A1Q2D0S1_9ACTN|nr:hypothetical protein BW733_15315 [Tessaracoccus flavescens]